MERVLITLSAKQHHYLISFIPPSERGAAKYLNYIYQVKKLGAEIFNPDQEITVSVEESLIPELYKLLAGQPGMYTEEYNPIIRQRLFEQLFANESLVSQLQAIAMAHTNQTESHILINGTGYVQSLDI